LYNAKEGKTLRRQWMQFTGLNGPFNKLDRRENHNNLDQDDPIGWWRMHGNDALEIQCLVIFLLSHIASSFAAERNWSTYNFIHSIKRNRLASKKVEKLVAVHNALHLVHRKTQKYQR
jgi:hypothetical protein